MGLQQNQSRIEPQGDGVDPVAASGDAVEKFREDISGKHDLTVFASMSELPNASAEKSLRDDFGGLSLISKDGRDLTNDPAARAFGA
ncbi:MAG: hypothetical protein IAF58_00755, partial [Leptolyngbya sp.]|nr:hypothetical protein [Candidatus Melainabacteria bacterium]